MTQPTAPIPVQPVIQYPKLAETGKTYVMRVDLQPLCTANDWPYQAEEYPVYCMVDASPLFECRPIGEPVVIVHRFGGTYGPATFLLTASRQPSKGVIKLHLFSGSGIPISMLELNDVRVLAQVVRQAPRSREEEPADTAEPVISKAPTVTPSPDNAKALRAYGQKLISVYEHLPLGRIAVLSSEKGTENQVRLAVVYIAPDTTELIRADLDQHWYDPELMKHISALRTVALNQRVALLGAPGSGKSTFLRYLTLGLASELVGSPADQLVQLLEWQLRANVPILVNLRNFAAWFASIDRSNSGSQAGPGLLWQFISSELAAWGLGVAIESLHSILVEGRAVVMFDEMDSAGDQIARVRKAITEFANHYSKNHYVVTCRTLFYQAAEQQLHRFAVAELAPFSGVQVDHFISAWYAELAHLGILSSSDQQQTAEVVKKALRHPGLSQLAHNPLTLTMMVLFHSYRSELPTHRTLLYEELVDLMLWHWERLKTDTIPDAMPSLLGMLHQVGRSEIDLKRVLWKLAFGACAQAIEQGKDGIEESYLLKALSALSSGDLGWAQQTLDTMKLRSSLLVEIRPRVFSFAHKVIQEYLAGSLLVAAQADFVRQSARLAVKDVRWHEVVLLAIEKMADLDTDLENLLVLTDELCPIETNDEELSWRTALLAGDALLVVDPNRASNLELGPELLERVRHRLSELVTLGRLEPSERARAGDSLGRLGDPRPGVGLRADGLPDIAWCDVPAGDFIMGSAKQTDSMAQDDEAPQHLERIPTHYYISKYPITNVQFDAFVRDGGYTDRWQHCWTVQGWRWKGDRTAPQKQGGVFDLPNHPVTMITWYEALAFCNWLGEKLGVTVSLPSEAQWERAGRGTDGRRYPWGDQLTPDHTNCAETGIGTTTAVGIFPKGANPEAGVLDMGGNVWEWCRRKWRDGYPSTPGEDVAGEGPRIVRGGSYISPDNELRCAYRRSSLPDSRSPDCGFRVVQWLEPDRARDIIRRIEVSDAVAPVEKQRLMSELTTLDPKLARLKLVEWITAPIAYEEWESAVTVLSGLDTPAARDALIQALSNPDAGLRLHAAARLADIGDLQSWQALRESYEMDMDSELRENLYLLLSKDTLSHPFLLGRHWSHFIHAIEPSQTHYEQAAEIVEFLRGKLGGIRELKKIYSEVTLFGSLARRTAIRPISDVDVLVLFSMDPKIEKPSAVYEMLKEALSRIYKGQIVEKTALRQKQGRVQRPGSSIGASVIIDLQESRLEVVPALYSKRTASREREIVVPDRFMQKWTPVNHDQHTSYANSLDDKTNGMYRSVVQAAKWWQRAHDPQRRYLSGFVMECLVAENLDREAPTAYAAFDALLKTVRRRYPTAKSLAYVPEMGVPSGRKATRMIPTAYEDFMKLIDETLRTTGQALKAESLELAVELWRQVFGPEFPMRVIAP